MDTTVAAEEALDLFDDRGLSYRNSKVSDAIFGSSPRHRALDDVKQSSSRRDSPTLPWRRVSAGSAQAGTASTPPRKPRRVASTSAVKRPDSPDIDTILAKTPRPRRSASSLFPSPASTSKVEGGARFRSTFSLRAVIKAEKSQDGDIESIIDEDLLEKLENDSESDGGGGSESDSSIDIHTSLPSVHS